MKEKEPNHNSSSDQGKNRFSWKKMISKKWFFPAIYVVVAALILTVSWWVQGNQLQQVTKTTKISQDLPTENVPLVAEEMGSPVASTEAVATKKYYDESSSVKVRESALVKYANTFWPHAGVDFARKDGKTFNVTAALNGKVVRIDQHPIVGRQIEIKHDNGLITVYQSLEDVEVQKGQVVKKGQIIGQAGRNSFEMEAGVHLHFEIRKNNGPMNPASYLPSLN